MKFITVHCTGYLLLCLTFQNTYQQRACIDVTLDNGDPSALDFITTSPDEKYIVMASHKWYTVGNQRFTLHEVSFYNLTDLAVHIGSLVASEIRGPNGMTIAPRSIGKGMWLLLVTVGTLVQVYAVNTSEEKVNMIYDAYIFSYLAIQDALIESTKTVVADQIDDYDPFIKVIICFYLLVHCLISSIR